MLGSAIAQWRAFVTPVELGGGFVGHRLQTKVRNMAIAAVSSSAIPFSLPQVGDNGRPGTMLEALEHLRKTREKDEELPKEYTVSEEQRPTIRHDEWADIGDIPVVDFSRLETDRAGLVKQLYSAAASERGFLQLVNHGLTLDEVRQVESEGLKFFELPAETKQKLGTMGYRGDNTSERGSSLHWAESLMIQPHNVDKILGEAWPAGNPEFRDAVSKFIARGEIINKQLMELLAESLVLPKDFFSQHLNSRKTLAIRWNFYPAYPRPSDVLGAASHTDGCSITLLIQDNVGGLQIQKDGKWIGIKPVEGAIVVNIGDTLHAWSNGIFQSVLHRVVVNESVHRLSLAAFYNVDSELSISAPEKLVDESHPRLYRPFTFGDYLRHILATRYQKDKAANKDGLLVLDGFKLND